MPEAIHLTPMFRQYQALKSHHADTILLFRMGDFYEMFFDDAKDASRLLELTLTARGKGTETVVPMCGFPYHQLEAYTARLVRADRRVAICEQVEDPKQTKGLVRREVVRVVTPGTVTDPAQLDSKENAWLCGVAGSGDRLGAAFLDVTTGEFLAWQSPPGDARSGWAALADRLARFRPREIVHAQSFGWPPGFAEDQAAGALLSAFDPYAFSTASGIPLLLRQFGVASLDGFGFDDHPLALAAAGGLLQYLQETQKCDLEHINEIALHEPSEFVVLDATTRRNLELERSLRDGGRSGSLFHAIDGTVTPAGGRLLRGWLLSPLVDPPAIWRRQEAVQEFLNHGRERAQVREQLAGIFDIERLLARTVSGAANPRDLLALGDSLARLPGLLELLRGLSAATLRERLDTLDPCTDVAARLRCALADDPPAALRDGGVLRDGFHAELDELRGLRGDGRSTIAAIEQRERAATGIGSLKVRYNKVFGYFIEVSKSNLHLVPENYHRKQTIANGERFVTPELKEHESRVLHAQERIDSLELELFHELRREIAGHAARLKKVAQAIAWIDVLATLAEIAATRDYVRPRVDRGRRLQIVAGRHPVVERNLSHTRFVPNDTDLEGEGRSIGVLTGPNMGGKSTYLRQVALITLLAQIGSFVPAESAEIGVVDRIFCRVGASDNLAEGQSTFMLEMTETANILHNATSRSLVLLDEIGRGTATFDGLSIAWAVVEHLDRLTGGAPRTLFATHYHELTELAVECDSVTNLRMAVREWGDKVVFLHRVEAGAADRSYGIHVARLAGVPRSVVQRAGEILANLEKDEYGNDGRPRRARRKPGQRGAIHQPSLFVRADEPPAQPEVEPDPAAAEVLAALRARDTDGLTPLQALNLVAEWRRRLTDSAGS